jgi:xanthine dehydrogenase accessory factor
MNEIYKEIMSIQLNGGEAALATIISTKNHTPRHVSSKMLIKSNGQTIGTIGGGRLENKLCMEAMNVIRDGVPKIIHFDLTGQRNNDIDMECGGIMDVFIEPIKSKPSLYIFGGGHISIPLSKIIKMTGFKVFIIDNRKEYANADRFPEADGLICKNFNEVLQDITINESSYIVIVTTEHKYDEQVLEMVIRSNAKYIGMVGSPKKRDIIFSNIISRGIPADLFKRVHCPVGIKINSETPEEIAVSIAAEIIKVQKAK